jgi:hypothetical protein
MSLELLEKALAAQAELSKAVFSPTEAEASEKAGEALGTAFRHIIEQALGGEDITDELMFVLANIEELRPFAMSAQEELPRLKTLHHVPRWRILTAEMFCQQIILLDSYYFHADGARRQELLYGMGR